MRGDFSRFWFDVKRFFSRVSTQQGDVQADTDADEYGLLRRILSFVEDSLTQAAQWAGFEPSDDPMRRFRRRRGG